MSKAKWYFTTGFVCIFYAFLFIMMAVCRNDVVLALSLASMILFLIFHSVCHFNDIRVLGKCVECLKSGKQPIHDKNTVIIDGKKYRLLTYKNYEKTVKRLK